MITGKISLIKNKEKEIAFPVTSAEAVYMPDGKTTVNEQLDTKANKVDLINYETTSNENLKLIIGRNDYLLKNNISFSSFNRAFYLDTDNAIKTSTITTPLASWWILDNTNEFVFQVDTESKWVVVGCGDDYSSYAVAVNIQGLANAKVIKMTKDGVVTDIDVGETRDSAVKGDYITVKINGNIVKFTKNNSDWFTIDTITYADIKNRHIGLLHAKTTGGLWSCRDFMKLNSIKSPDMVNVNVEIVAKKESVWKDKTFVSLGDSIMWQDGQVYASGVNQGKIAKGFQSHLKEKLGFASYLNKAVSGRSMANGTPNGDGTNTTGKTVDYSTFDLVTIGAGTNDFKLNVPLGSLGDVDDTVFDTNTFYGAYRDLIEFIIKRKPTIRICLLTPLPRNNGGYNSWNTVNTAGHKLIDYVNAIKEIGEMYSIPVCDMYLNSGFCKWNLGTYTMDGLHPNDFGYEKYASYAVPFVDNVGI